MNGILEKVRKELRAASDEKTRQSGLRVFKEEVFNYLMAHKSVMPRTALRYAIEKMLPDLKAKAMEK